MALSDLKTLKDKMHKKSKGSKAGIPFRLFYTPIPTVVTKNLFVKDKRKLITMRIL